MSYSTSFESSHRWYWTLRWALASQQIQVAKNQFEKYSFYFINRPNGGFIWLYLYITFFKNQACVLPICLFFRSLVKRVDVGLSVQPVEDETVEEIMVQGGAVSPIVTIEPRRYRRDWCKKNGLAQNFAISKKSTIFIQSSRNFGKIISQRDNNFGQVSLRLNKNCRFF